MIDLDLRVVRYFVRIAELGSFTRASAELHVSQPSLSRQIRSLEDELGVRLLNRQASGSRVTPAGSAFLSRAHGLLRAADDAVDVATRAPTTFVIGHAVGVDATTTVRQLRQRFPNVDVRTVHLGWRRPAEELRSGRADAVLARLPFPHPGLTVDVLYDEPRFVAVHIDHPFARRPYVTVDDLATEALPGVAGMDRESRDFWHLGPGRDAEEGSGSAVVSTLDDTWQMVAQGDVVAVVTRAHARVAGPGIVLVPLDSAPPAQVALAVRDQDRSAIVRVLRDGAQEWCAGPVVTPARRRPVG